MKLLLDTCVFLWWTMNDSRLPESVKNTIASREVNVHVSIASLWEMAIKVSLNRLEIPRPMDHWFENELALNHFDLLHLHPGHFETLCTLPDIHKDPFDRILIAQSKYENITLTTHDGQIARYDLQLLKF